MSLKKLIRQFKKEEGTTLVELLAAIAILTIIVTAFLAFFTQAGRTNNMTDETNQATFIAVEEMEKITNLSQQKKTFKEMKDEYLKTGSGYSSNTNSEIEMKVVFPQEELKKLSLQKMVLQQQLMDTNMMQS